MAQSWMKRWGKGKESGEPSIDTADQEPPVESPDWDGHDAMPTHAEDLQVDQEPAPPIEEKRVQTTDILAYLFVFLILIILIPTTIVATFEISNRVDFVSFIDKEIAKHKTEWNDLDKNQTKSDNNQKAKAGVVSDINTLEKFREAAYVIMANGAIPLEGDVFSFRDLIVLKAKSSQGSSSLVSILHGDAAINKSKAMESSPVIARVHAINLFIDNLNDVFSGFVCNYNSNSLLAVSLILSSIIGSLAFHFRKDGGTSFLLRGIISGLVMGFIIYLVVKGGKNLFSAESEGAIKFSLNLYGSCLIAFLTGALADRLFRLLRSLVGLVGQKG